MVDSCEGSLLKRQVIAWENKEQKKLLDFYAL